MTHSFYPATLCSMKKSRLLFSFPFAVIGTAFLVWLFWPCNITVPRAIKFIPVTIHNSLMPLQVESLQDRRVKIKGPTILLKKANSKVMSRWTACGFWVDWGDKSTLSESLTVGSGCSKLLTHTYMKTGFYHIKTHIYHLGHDDGQVIDWSGSILFQAH